MSKHIIIGTAGHVDHGKTSLIRALTGFDCDTHKEEKTRGITINLGFTHVDFDNGDSAGIVDVPGHKDFIKTMISGASGIDMVMLVIAADSGIMPQTREHLSIIQMLGIEHGIIVLNKCDLVDEEMLELAKLEVMEFIEETPLKDAKLVEVSASTGKGIDELKKMLVDTIQHVPAKSTSGLFRMYIDRIFNVKGKGIVVTGSVLNGSVRKGDDLFLLPARDKKAKVKEIQRHGLIEEMVQAGDRAAINLAGIKAEQFERGMILSNEQLEETAMLDVELKLFSDNFKLDLWSQVLFHAGSFSSMAKVHLINKEKCQAGETVIAQVHLEKSVTLQTLDKFIIRNSSNDATLGGGTIIDHNPLHHKRRTGKLIQTLEKKVDALLYTQNLADLILAEMSKQSAPMKLSELGKKLNVSEQEILDAILDIKDEMNCLDIKEEKVLLGAALKNDYERIIVQSIAEFHGQNTLSDEGLGLKAIEGKLNLPQDLGAEFLNQLLKQLVVDEKLKVVNTTYSLFTHTAKIDRKTKEQLEWLENQILNYRMEVPVLQNIENKAADEKINKGRLKLLLKYLADKKILYFANNQYLHKNVVDKSRKLLREHLLTKPDGINEKEFKELINGTKKIVQVLIPIFVNEKVIIKDGFFLRLIKK